MKNLHSIAFGCTLLGMTPTRRSLFSAFASLTPAAGAVDPIFAAISRHRAAWNAAEAAMDDVSRHHVERTAAEALAATVPASRAGIRALLGYLRDLERSLPQNSPDLLAPPTGTLPRLSGSVLNFALRTLHSP